MAFFSLAVRNFAEWAPPILEPDGPMEHEVIARLALIVAGQGAQRRPGRHRRPDDRRRAGREP